MGSLFIYSPIACWINTFGEYQELRSCRYQDCCFLKPCFGHITNKKSKRRDQNRKSKRHDHHSFCNLDATRERKVILISTPFPHLLNFSQLSLSLCLLSCLPQPRLLKTFPTGRWTVRLGSIELFMALIANIETIVLVDSPLSQLILAAFHLAFDAPLAESFSICCKDPVHRIDALETSRALIHTSPLSHLCPLTLSLVEVNQAIKAWS